MVMASLNLRLRLRSLSFRRWTQRASPQRMLRPPATDSDSEHRFHP